MKLKSLLEGYAWERNTDGSLPTLADTTAAHARKVQEEANSLTETATRIPIANEPGEFIIAGKNNMVRFIPSANTTVERLRNVSPGEIQDTLQAYCESKTGLKFSPVWNDEGAGYAFIVDIYSIINKLQGNHASK